MVFLNRVKRIIAPYCYKMNFLISRLMSFVFKPRIIDYRDIPIIINNRNRYTYLIALIESLEQKGYRNIIILDNASDYPALKAYYQTCKHRVFFLNKNLGYKALIKCDLYKEIRRDYYVYTDPDVVPIKECPDDFLKYFWDILKKNPHVQKVGFSLKIDDLPDCDLKKNDVIEWERKFYANEIMPNIFKAPIDTTFALHRPWTLIGDLHGATVQYRIGFPYQMYHLPWYEDTLNPTYESLYYSKHAVIGGHWTNGKI